MRRRFLLMRLAFMARKLLIAAAVLAVILLLNGLSVMTASWVVDRNYNGLSVQMNRQVANEPTRPAIALTQCP